MRCPTCEKPVPYTKENPFRPFCSERCKLLDFGAWVDGEYAVPAEEAAPSVEELGQNQPAPGDNNEQSGVS